MAGMGETCDHVAAAMYRTILPVQAMPMSGCQIEKLLKQKR